MFSPKTSSGSTIPLLIVISWQVLQTIAAAAGNGSQQQQPPPAVIQRGVKIGDEITAKSLFQAYEEIKDEYSEKAFGANQEDWVVVKEGADGLNVAMLHHPSDPSCPYVRLHATMPGSVDDVWGSFRLSNWERLMSAVDPFFEGLTILEQYDYGKVNLVLARKRAKRLVAFGKRDFLFVSVSDVPRPDGVLVSGTVSVVTSKYPRVEGYVRAYQDSIGFYEPHSDNPETGEPQTSVTIICRIDLNDSGEDGEGGLVPMWLYTQTIGLSGSSSLAKMRKQMRLEMEERRAAAEGRTLQRTNGGDLTTVYSALLVTALALMVGLYVVKQRL